MKKLIYFIVMIGLVVSLCGCSDSSSKYSDSSSKYEEALETLLGTSANIVQNMYVDTTVGDVISFMYKDPSGGMSVKEEGDNVIISFTGACSSDMSLINDGIYPFHGTITFIVYDDGTCELYSSQTSRDAYAAFISMALALG